MLVTYGVLAASEGARGKQVSVVISIERSPFYLRAVLFLFRKTARPNCALWAQLFVDCVGWWLRPGTGVDVRVGALLRALGVDGF